MNPNTATDILLSLLRCEPATDGSSLDHSQTLTNGTRVATVTPDMWRAVSALAEQGRLQPLLYSRLEKRGLSGQVPPDLLQELRRVYLLTARRNTRAFHQLGLLLRRFQAESISCIPLKGAYLAERVYGNIGLRPMTDLDLLVKADDLDRVDQLMCSSGYRFCTDDPNTIERNVHRVYFHEPTRLFVEVHWTLASEPVYGIRVDIDGLWGRSRVTRVADAEVREMSAEDQVLHLAVHAAKHKFLHFGLNAMIDVAETLRCFQDTLDWERLCLRARDWRAERCLYVTLYLAARLVNAPVPEGVLTRLGSHPLAGLYLAAAEENALAGPIQGKEAFRPTRNFADFWLADGLGPKIQLIWQSTFPGKHEMATMYRVSENSPRMILYYPVRLWDLLRRYARALWDLHGRHEGRRRRAESRVQSVLMRDWLFAADTEHE